MTIRPFRKPSTMARVALGAMVLSLCVAPAPGLTAAYARTLEDYVVGMDGEFQCYPLPDTTASGEV